MYTIWESRSSDTLEGGLEGTETLITHVVHATVEPALKEGPTNPDQEDAYGPWLMVTRKRQGPKLQKSTRS